MTARTVPILTTLAVAALVISIGALGFSIVAVSRHPKTDQPKNATAVARLEGEIRSLSSRLEAAHSEAEESASKAREKFAKLATCMPELTGQINGLTAEVLSGSVFLSQHAQVSHYCQPVLEGHF